MARLRILSGGVTEAVGLCRLWRKRLRWPEVCTMNSVFSSVLGQSRHLYPSFPCIAQTPTVNSLQKRLTSEMRPPMSSVLVQGLPPHADDIGEDGLYDSPLDELWGLKLRMDLVRLVATSERLVLADDTV